MHDLEWSPGCSWHTLATGISVLWRSKLKPGLKIAGESCVIIASALGLFSIGAITTLIYANDCGLTPNKWVASIFFLGNAMFGGIVAGAIITTKREWQNCTKEERWARWRNVKHKCRSQVDFVLFLSYFIAIVWRLDIGGSWSIPAIALALLPPILLLVHWTRKLASHVCQLGAAETHPEH